MKGVSYKLERNGIYAPSLNEYNDAAEAHMMNPGVVSDFAELESYAASKYFKEHLKICAFYNKLFPSLDTYSAFNGATYNALPFTITDQEVADAGTGISKNYLKAAIDTVVARLKNISFEVRLQAGSPLILLEMYKRQIERYFKSQIRSNRLEHLVTECFHDAAILGYSHIFMDPWSKKIRKINDWEIGYYETEFEAYDVKRCIVKHNSFPVASLAPYVDGINTDTLRTIINGRNYVQLYLYMDCFRRQKFVQIEGTVGPMTPYPFDSVLFCSYIWDVGIRRTYTSSLFDLLFPLQRQINKLSAKLTTIYMNYKGPTPVISTAGDCDIIVRQLSNKSGEVLMLQGGVADVTKMVGVVDPIPLNPALNAEIEALKANMLELAGVQEISMNLDNLRSAAAVVALDQLRDSRFESQLFHMARFVEDVLVNVVKFNAGLAEVDNTEVGDVPWKSMLELIDSTFLQIIPIHGNDPQDKPVDAPEDFQLYAVDRFIMDIINKTKTYEDMDYTINRVLLKKQAVNKLLRFRALGGDYYELEHLCIMLFIADIQAGVVQLESQESGEGEQPNDSGAGGGEPSEAQAGGGGEQS